MQKTQTRGKSPAHPSAGSSEPRQTRKANSLADSKSQKPHGEEKPSNRTGSKDASTKVAMRSGAGSKQRTASRGSKGKKGEEKEVVVKDVKRGKSYGKEERKGRSKSKTSGGDDSRAVAAAKEIGPGRKREEKEKRKGGKKKVSSVRDSSGSSVGKKKNQQKKCKFKVTVRRREARPGNADWREVEESGEEGRRSKGVDAPETEPRVLAVLHAGGEEDQGCGPDLEAQRRGGVSRQELELAQGEGQGPLPEAGRRGQKAIRKVDEGVQATRLLLDVRRHEELRLVQSFGEKNATGKDCGRGRV